VKRVLLLLAFVLLQGQVDPTVRPQKPMERPRVMEESNVDSLLPTTGAARVLSVLALEGVPADPRARTVFLKGFHDAFREGDLRTERVAKPGGKAQPGGTLHNRFRLAEAGEDKDTWTARVRLEWFAPRPDTVPGRGAEAESLARIYPGIGVRVELQVRQPPDADDPGPDKPAAASAVALRFPAGHPVDAPYWQLAGRQVGFVLLEAVHRAEGDLTEEQRLVLESARRLPAAPDGAPPR